MIAAGEPQEFSPYGREHCKLHPGENYIATCPVNNGRSDLGLQLLSAFKDVSIKEKSEKGKEQWILRPTSECNKISCDEELYASEHTAVWSSGNSLTNRNVLKTFTVDYPIQQVLWCNFFMTDNKPTVSMSSSNYKQGSVYPSVCISDTANMYSFTGKGEEFITALPFQVAQIWPMKFGLLLERTVTSSELSYSKTEQDLKPTLFSLLHPLDEITPVIRNGCLSSAPKVNYMNDPQMQVIFVNENPSLVLFYNSSLSLHTVWKVRQAKIEEVQNLFKIRDNTHTYLHSAANTPHSNQQFSTGQSHFTLSSHSPSQLSSSPFRNFGSKVNTPVQLSRPQSPSGSGITHMAALSRSQSPSASGNNPYRYVFTPSPNSRSSVGVCKTPCPSTNHSLRDSDLVEPLTPDICLELLWTETLAANRANEDGKASHAFITSDYVGQTFLCYVIPGLNQIRCVKFEESNDLTQLIFGVMNVIPGKDAVALSKCEMMLVVDVSHTLVLYSGVNKICRVHIPSSPVSFINFAADPSHFRAQGSNSRRGSAGGSNLVVTSSRPASAMDARFDDEVNLSPVQSESGGGFQFEGSYLDDSNVSISHSVIKLRDPVHNRVTLEFSNGSVFRTTIPKITESSLVSVSLQAIRNVLPRELALQLYTKWYSTVNALGSGKNNRSHEWSTFAACLLGMMGYDLERLPVTKQLEIDTLMTSPTVVTKKFKSSNAGTEEDWNYLTGCMYHNQVGNGFATMLGLSDVPMKSESSGTSGSVSITAVLFQHIPAILYALHIVYEELKLNVLLWKDLELLAPLLIQLARDLRVQFFLDYYWKDFPTLFVEDSMTQVDEHALKSMLFPIYLTAEPPSIFQWLHDCLLGKSLHPFPYISQVSSSTKAIILLYAAMTYKDSWNATPVEKYLRKITAAGVRSTNMTMNSTFETLSVKNVHEIVVKAMTQLEMKVKDLDCLPVGVSLPLRNAIFQCRRNPPSNWPQEAYVLIGRPDLSAQLKDPSKNGLSFQRKKGTQTNNGKKPILSKEEDDGMENLDYEVLKLRFNSDQRVQEVRRLLQSSKPVRVALVQRPEVSDHDFIEEQERYLYAVCMRTMALPVGRGMFTLRTSQPVTTETLPIPKLCLTGRAPPRNTTVDLTHIEPPPNMNVWPLFHNGVAAGLKIVPHASQVDSPWIVYNEPKGSNDTRMEHAGFLMALGLTGHLKNLDLLNKYEYLTKRDELTSVGVLLGVAASERGTMNLSTIKSLSIHLDALLPPTSTEIGIPHVVQVAAILSVGLLYDGTRHCHMSEVLLSEIGRPPGPEMENSSDRESYSLAAGLGLGLVTFGAGNEVGGLQDISMADQLYHYMVGGYKRPLSGAHKEKYKSPSYQIKEGDSVNIDVTSPGATLALGMMYFKTGNRAVAEWMNAPDTQNLLDFVRPDFLLLRTFSKGLILWDDVHPSAEWVMGHVPTLVSKYAFKKTFDNEEIDLETMNQAYCNILAGACMAIGFRFAGSANALAFKTLHDYVMMFINVFGKQAAEQAGKSTVDSCLNVILLALAMVMAGTGDLEVLRICRFLHFRVGQPNNHVLYGSHMATHMALGLLFLGGGRCTLATHPKAIAAMVCAFFPKFPILSCDNRYHLQAFRHLYVLAVEPRLVIPRDIDTGKLCYANLQIKFMDTQWYKDIKYEARAPCILPGLDNLSEVTCEDSRYWAIKFDKDTNWQNLKSLLENGGLLYVKQKAGCLSYVDDPQGFRSLFSQSLSKDNTTDWAVKPVAIEAFSCDASVSNFAKYYLQEPKNSKEGALKQLLCGILYDCVTQEKTEILPSCISIIQALHDLPTMSCVNSLWQIKLIATFMKNTLEESGYNPGLSEHMLNPEFALAIQSKLERKLQKWKESNGELIKAYLSGQHLKYDDDVSHLVAFLVYYDVPSSEKLGGYLSLVLENGNLAGISMQLQELCLSTSTLNTLLSIK